ncbi:MAG: UDP-glucuronate decarboxylase, partial [Candidatus Uhrbacteria bacterium GW2011_GWD2_52_7]
MEQTISWDGLGSPVLELWAYPDNGSGSGHLSAYIRRISDGAVVYTIANYGADQHGPWRRHFVNIDSIPGLAGLKEARLVLEINTGNNGGFTGYFDDIALHEGVSPSTVTDLAAVSETSTDAIKLSWTAPGDDGSIGVLNNSTFTIQYATYTTVAWSTSSAQVEISTSGVAPGTSQYYTLDGLSANTSYYFRLWTKDSSANYSPLSNGATAATLTNPVTGTQVISVYFSGATVSWNALPVSPSSATCEGYILQASTSEVYGDPQVHPQPESYLGNVNTLGPRSCYDEGKRVAETLMMDYHRQNNVDIRIIRIFNTYGPKMAENDGRVVSNFILQALKGEDITVYGEGEQTRSFCFVSDLVEGMVRMMECPGFIGPVNLGNPCETTILEFARKIIALTGSKSSIVYRPLPADDPKQRQPDISLAKEMLGWEPKIQLEDGLVKTIDYFRKKV